MILDGYINKCQKRSLESEGGINLMGMKIYKLLFAGFNITFLLLSIQKAQANVSLLSQNVISMEQHVVDKWGKEYIDQANRRYIKIPVIDGYQDLKEGIYRVLEAKENGNEFDPMIKNIHGSRYKLTGFLGDIPRVFLEDQYNEYAEDSCLFNRATPNKLIDQLVVIYQFKCVEKDSYDQSYFFAVLYEKE